VSGMSQRISMWSFAAVCRSGTVRRSASSALQQAVPALTVPVECTQTATAAYVESGFTAAAFTICPMVTVVPQFVERTIRRVELTFDQSHTRPVAHPHGDGELVRRATPTDPDRQRYRTR
jgi:hypothetical protein